MSKEKLGRQVLFRKADGVTIGARVGSASYDRLANSGQFVKLEPISYKERAENFKNIVIEKLTIVNGIGEATAKLLGDAGFISIKDITDSTPEQIDEATELSFKQASKVYTAAMTHGDSE